MCAAPDQETTIQSNFLFNRDCVISFPRAPLLRTKAVAPIPTSLGSPLGANRKLGWLHAAPNLSKDKGTLQNMDDQAAKY